MPQKGCEARPKDKVHVLVVMMEYNARMHKAEAARG